MVVEKMVIINVQLLVVRGTGKTSKALTYTRKFPSRLSSAVPWLCVTLVTMLLGAACDPDMARLPGNRGRFDPVAHMNRVQSFAGAEEGALIEMTASCVSRNGTIDFTRQTTGNIRVQYKFIRPEPGTEEHRNVWVNVFHTGMWRLTQGAQRYSRDEERVRLPTVSFAEIWRVALENGAPDDSFAFFKYDRSGYSFHTGMRNCWQWESARFELRLDLDGNPIREGSDID